MRGLEIRPGSPQRVISVLKHRGYRVLFEEHSRTSLVRNTANNKIFPRFHLNLEKGDNNSSLLYLHIDISVHSPQKAGKFIRRESNYIEKGLRNVGEEVHLLSRKGKKHKNWGDKNRALQEKINRARKQEKYPGSFFPEEGVIFPL